MESAATYCGTVYPWQCDQVGHMNIIAAICETTGVHMDRQARKSAPFADSIRKTAAALLAVSEPAGA